MTEKINAENVEAKQVGAKEKKPFYKRKWFFALAAVVLLMGAFGGNSEDSEEAPVPEDPAAGIEEPAEEATAVELAMESDVEPREDSIGKSHGDFSEVTGSSPRDVREDTTGNWRILTMAEAVDLEEYILSYADMHMEPEEVHAIVNFHYKTTTMINDFGSYLSVRVHEYVEKEEHDANVLGSGLFLEEYQVYRDNGDIVRVD